MTETADWIKLHGMVGTTTHIIAAAHIGDEGDSVMLPPLLSETAKHFRVDEVSGDKAYCTYENHDAVGAIGATPYFAFKKNTTAEQGGLFEKMFHLFYLNREQFLDRYHERSNAESAFSALKRRLGHFLRSKTDTALVNEALAKCVAHNLSCVVSAIHELGILPIFQSLGFGVVKASPCE